MTRLGIRNHGTSCFKRLATQQNVPNCLATRAMSGIYCGGSHQNVVVTINGIKDVRDERIARCIRPNCPGVRAEKCLTSSRQTTTRESGQQYARRWSAIDVL